METFRTGTVALIGKPNVGKSTLLNRMVGQKVSIVSDKPQTTRRRVLGIARGEGYEIAFLDTPGIHHAHTRLSKAMIDQARRSLAEVDLIVVVVDGGHHPGERDKEIARLVQETPTSRLLCLNKMDKLKAENVENFVRAYGELFGTEDYMMTTATKGHNVEKLMTLVAQHLPEGEPQYSEDEYTTQTSRFMAAELVREKILHATRQEVPHATAVLIENWETDERGLLRIAATILVEKTGQKAILIGKQGQFLKHVGTSAREEIEALLGQKVFLELHVKVRTDWRMDLRALRELEYTEE